MRYKYVFAILCTMHCAGAMAVIGSIDERQYVDWHASPYNKIVYFYGTGTCTAEYVARDIILTARHCITHDNEFDNYKVNGKKFTIKLHDGRKTDVTLEKYGRDNDTDDWAMLRITDQAFFSDDIFSVSPTNQTTTVTNAGFGYLRVLKDDEIPKLKRIFASTARQQHESHIIIRELLDSAMDEIAANNIPYLIDFTDETKRCLIGDNPERCEPETNLKAHIGCKLTQIQSAGKIIRAACHTVGGNSGGPYFSGDTLYAISHSSFDNFKDLRRGGAWTIASSVIWKNLQDMVTPGTGASPAPADNNNAQENDTAVEADLQQREQDLTTRATTIENQSDQEFFYFLSDAVDYKVLKERYERAKAREQSFANKLLGAATIVATGIGTEMLMQGLAEQKADAQAETDMHAYLETMRCGYDGGQQFTAGRTDIALPGNRELSELKQQYTQLAQSLRDTKDALEIAPGIESETILTRAETGLYDDEYPGKTDGANASVARAMLDPNGTDAADWQTRKDNTKATITKGAIVGGTGAVGGAIGNLIINRNRDDDKDKHTVQ